MITGKEDNIPSQDDPQEENTVDSNPKQENLTHWERYTEWPLAVVSLIFLAIYTMRVLGQPRGMNGHLATTIMAVSWAIFAVDYAAHLWLAPKRLSWFLRHLPSLAVLVLPLLQPLRIIRLIILVEALQHALSKVIHGRVAAYTVLSAILLVYTSSLAELQVERYAPGATLTSFSKALWWSIITITTVGYGDAYPITPTGRIIAAVLMISGITLLGMITATITSWIANRVSPTSQSASPPSPTQSINAAELAALRRELTALRQQIHSLTVAHRSQQKRDSHPSTNNAHRNSDHQS